jgi:hypothetical protein
MRAKRDWERVRSPHARFLEGLEAAVASHPSASSRRVGATAKKPPRAARSRLTVVDPPVDNVLYMPTDGSRRARKAHPAGRGRSGTDGSPAA